MARRSTEYDQFVMSGQKTAPQSTTTFGDFSAIIQNNERLASQPEVTPSFSAFSPVVETVNASVPKLASDTPDWAKRTPTEQARVNAAQARAQEQSASTPAVGYALLDPNASPYNGGMPTYGNAPASGYATLSDEYVRRATTKAPTSAPVSPYAQPASPYNYVAPKVETVSTTGTAPSFANIDDVSKAKLKQNNPALYNQLLVQGIITPLAEDQKQTATVPSVGAVSPSTGETELTGYAQFATDYAKKEAQIEGEYARSLPTYGALAEQMAQAGIHGGYSDYLQGVAYAKMQDAKENLRNGYSQFSGVGAGSDTAKELYSNLLSENGETLAGITDETQYKQWEDSFRAANKGVYSDADVEWTLNNMRNYRQTTLNNAKTSTQDLVKQYGTGEKTSDDILSAYGLSVVKGKDADGNDIEETDKEYEARKAESVRWVLSQAVKDGLIDNKELSATVKSKLAIYDADFGNKSWKSAGEDIYNSVSTAIDDKKDGVLTDADLQTVLNDAIKAMGVSSVTLDYIGGVSEIHPDLKLTLKDGTKLKADYNGRANETVSEALTRKYGNMPLVVYDDQLYYQYPTDDGRGKSTYTWYKLKTKTGSPGTTEQGDRYFATVAKIMMYYNNAEKMEKAGDANNRYRTWDIKTGKITYSKK